MQTIEKDVLFGYHSNIKQPNAYFRQLDLNWQRHKIFDQSTINTTSFQSQTQNKDYRPTTSIPQFNF